MGLSRRSFFRVFGLGVAGVAAGATATKAATRIVALPAVPSLTVAAEREAEIAATRVTTHYRTWALGFRVPDEMLADDHFEMIDRLAEGMRSALCASYDRQMHAALGDAFPGYHEKRRLLGGSA